MSLRNSTLSRSNPAFSAGRSIWRALVMDRNPAPGASYIFVIPSFKDNSGMVGYMPLKSGYGFITPRATPRDVAHELGHGKFHLRHTFSEKNANNLPKSTTQNLMDYSTGYELWKYQWDYIHDPEGGWFLFQDVEEAAYISEDNEVEWILEIYSPMVSE
jgi:hypothetical protein